MSKNKKQSLEKMQTQLEKDIAKFNVVFESWTDDDKILYNRLHLQDKRQYAANTAIGFVIDEYSAEQDEAVEKYKSYIAKLENKNKEMLEAMAETPPEEKTPELKVVKDD